MTFVVFQDSRMYDSVRLLLMRIVSGSVKVSIICLRSFEEILSVPDELFGLIALIMFLISRLAIRLSFSVVLGFSNLFR